VVNSFEHFCRRQRLVTPPLCVTVENEIPLCGGLGGSAAAIVAGLALGQLAGSDRINRKQLLALGAEREGHPDNAASAVYGGLQVCRMGSGRIAQAGRIDERIRLVVAAPRTRADTANMRSILPATWPGADLAENEKLLTRLMVGLISGDPFELKACERDLLHQPYRFPALPISKKIFEAMIAVEAIAGAYLSGSGSAVAGFVVGNRDPRPQLAAMLAEAGIDAELFWLEPDRTGIRTGDLDTCEPVPAEVREPIRH
jgi:homoserine kinase